MSGGTRTLPPNLPGMAPRKNIAFGDAPFKKEKPKPPPKGLPAALIPESELSGLSSLFNELNNGFARNSNMPGGNMMAFGKELQSKASHDALLKLCDQEIRLLETMKKCITLRIKCDRDYTTSLAGFSTLGSRLDGMSIYDGQVYQAWSTVLKETDNICQKMKKSVEDLNENVLNKLNNLIREKIEMKRRYVQERIQVDTDYLKMKDEVTENFIKYQKIARDARDTKAKYDEAVSKGKSDKDLMKLKDKYRKNTVRLHKVHNDYVVSIHTAQTHQEHYKEVVLPRLLDAHQQAEESYVSQVKQLLTHYAGLTNTSNLDYQNMNENLLQGIRNIQPTEEYVAFIDANKGAEEWVNIEFDHRVNDDYTDAYLKTSDIAMDNLTYEDITHKCTEVSELLEKCKEDIKKKEDALAVLDVEIKSISPTEAQDSMIQELLSKQREYRECFKSIGLLQCDEAKLSVQLELFHQKITELGDATPHSGIDFNTSEVDLTKNKNDSMDKGKKLKKPKTLFKKNKSNVSEVHIPEEEGEEYSEIAMQKSLTDEDWYHGCIPRPEAVTLLEKDGQFLVRQKGDDSGQIVLSVKWEGKHKHFPIQKNAEGQFRLEGDNYGTVSELIEYQMKTHKPVTKLSGAILLSFIQRHWDLTHDDIEIAEFLGKGNFGDVMKGYLKKDRTPVAVKTCKENVDPIIRQKFLMEARILKQYDHKNIVKLVGVCTERQPVYIVMEFIAGGDFLNFLRNQGGSMSIPQLVRMSENAAAGMAYLSSKKCIHRDLAARNCLVGDNNIVKISDFGMSRQEEDGLYMVSGGMKQIPIKWTAPEAMNYGEYTIECDVWSYGILLWEIFSRGNIPYPGMNNATAREKIENGYRMSAPDGTPNEIHELMLECWKYHPQDRITFEQIHRTLVRLCKVIK